jgi:RNase P subunit RPR2
MGLGSLDTLSLSEAREKAVEQRRFIDQGIDLIEARKAARSDRALGDAKAMTCKACATAYIDAHKAGWRNAKHADLICWKVASATAGAASRFS